MHYISYNTIFALAFSLFFIPGCSYTPTSPYLTTNPNVKPADQDIADYVNRNIKSSIPVYDNPPLQQYIRTVGMGLEKNLKISNLAINYILLDMKDVIAFCVFDGHIYLTTGLLKTLENEAELAAVIAHELGHVMSQSNRRERLFVKNLSKSSKILAGKVTQDIGDDFFSTMDNVLAYGKHRESEYEADHFSMELLYLSGYHPSALSTTLEKFRLSLNQKSRDETTYQKNIKLIEIFSTHPALPERIKTANTLAKKFGDLKLHTLNKDIYKKHVNLLVQNKPLDE